MQASPRNRNRIGKHLTAASRGMLPTRRNRLSRISFGHILGCCVGLLIVNADDADIQHPGPSQFQDKLIERVMLIQNPLILYFFIIPHYDKPLQFVNPLLLLILNEKRRR